MNKNIKSIKLNSSNIIAIRENIDNTIKKYRKIIKTENVMSTKAIKAGVGSNFDLKALYNTIDQLSETRIKIKGALQYLNMGINTFDYNKFKETHYYSIFKASEEKEKLTFLNILKTTCINPVEKSKKGMKGTGKREIFSSAKIASLMKNIQLEINKYDSKIEEFNKFNSVTFTEIDENIQTLLTT